MDQGGSKNLNKIRMRSLAFSTRAHSKLNSDIFSQDEKLFEEFSAESYEENSHFNKNSHHAKSRDHLRGCLDHSNAVVHESRSIRSAGVRINFNWA